MFQLLSCGHLAVHGFNIAWELFRNVFAPQLITWS